MGLQITIKDEEKEEEKWIINRPSSPHVVEQDDPLSDPSSAVGNQTERWTHSDTSPSCPPWNKNVSLTTKAPPYEYQGSWFH